MDQTVVEIIAGLAAVLSGEILRRMNRLETKIDNLPCQIQNHPAGKYTESKSWKCLIPSRKSSKDTRAPLK